MEKTMAASCINDEGIYSQIPGSVVRIITFVDAYHRLGDDLEQLRTGFLLEHWQFHAAMAFYFANKAFFDAEYERILETRRKFWEESKVKDGERNGWAELYGAFRDDEADEEINKLLEEMS